MTNSKKMILKVAALLVVLNQTPAFAASADSTDSPKTKTAVQVPVVIEADKLYYSDQTGDYSAQGQVRVTKELDQILSQRLTGNAKNGEITTEDTATLLQPGISLTGSNVRYNYQTRAGDMDAVTGKIEKIFVGGKAVSMLEGKVTVHDGTVTGCPEEKPHYYLDAARVEIWPGDKLIAYNAKVVVGKVTLFSIPKLEKSLKQKTSTTVLPRVAYDSKDGIMIGQYISYPLGNQTAIYGDFRYFTERGFEPQYGITAQGKSYTVEVFQGSEKNNDDEWIKKEHELRFELEPKRFGKLPAKLHLSASAGKWTEGVISDTRNSYKAYLASDAFKLNDNLSLKLGIGYENVYYGYNKTYNDILRFDSGLDWVSKRTEAWLGYSTRNQTNQSVYEYDRIDIAREMKAGILYQVDKKNKLGMSIRYDVDRSKLEEVKYSWHHNMHCVDSVISFETKKDRLSLNLTAISF